MVGVAGVVIGFNHLQPRAQSGLRTVEELTDPKPGEDLQAKVGERPAEKIGVRFPGDSRRSCFACVPLLPLHGGRL